MAAIDHRPGIRPRISVGQRLDAAARAALPACITILLMLLSEAPLGIPGQTALLPAVTLCCVWFWSVSSPDMLPAPVVFLIGLLLDLLSYLPLGVGVFTLLAVHSVALAVRPAIAAGRPIWAWVVFAAVSSVAALVIWLMTMLLTFRILSPGPAIFIAVATAALFPLLAASFAWVKRSIVRPEHA